MWGNGCSPQARQEVPARLGIEPRPLGLLPQPCAPARREHEVRNAEQQQHAHSQLITSVAGVQLIHTTDALVC